MKCPFVSEFGKWIECPYYEEHDGNRCTDLGISNEGHSAGKGGSWCATMIGRAMLAHKTWIGNDY